MKVKKTYRLEQETINELEKLCEDRGWSLREFGLVIGMNKTYLGDIELGKRNPTVRSLAKIAAGYGMTLKEFFAKMPD